MEQGSAYYGEKEDVEMMNIEEVARSIEYLRALGLTDTQIADYHTYIATGVGLPLKEPDTKKEA